MEFSTSQIRKLFIEYFENKSHKFIPSAPVVLKNDPTLMFTNAGMNQFKDFFLGHRQAKYTRVVNSQKCLRVSGKHNDLEEVGIDGYHHTFFEMLGNWSFGDYFKAEAIEWAWDLLTNKYKIDKDRLYVTVFGGDTADGLEKDTEAAKIWEKFISPDRILFFGKKDNFWEMGDVGPCGPCSEIHIDLRSDDERKKIDGKTLVNADHEEVIELWNLVFIQYNRKQDGTLEELPSKHIDTGMGLERLARVLQNKKSNYEIDIFSAIIGTIEQFCHVKYGENPQTDIAFRVVADHLRAVSFAIADGQLPSNTGAGYVIRRILRRAIRYGYSYLNIKEPFIHRLVKVLVKEMGNHYTELSKQQSFIEKVILEEEQAFLRTLEKGLERFENYITKNQTKIIDGDFAFELYDTYGFPIDLTNLLAEEKGLKIDMAGFEENLLQQKNRSRAATEMSTGDWVVLEIDDQEEFIGYDHTEAKVKIIKYRKIKLKGKDYFQLVFNITPFYAESGGQVGDTGYIEDSEGNKTYIIDTKKENDLIVHFTKELPVSLNDTFKAVVDVAKRKNTEKNHSATHLLHYALRKVLGTHVEQRGSLVAPEYLRFDFSHFEKVSAEQLQEVELLVNKMIAADIHLEEKRNIPIAEAKEMGAMALFGEKYGDVVRVIKFGESVELCGGTHVKTTANIGWFKIVSESSIASGIRRIEAVTGEYAYNFIQGQLDELRQIKELLKNPKDVAQSVKKVLHSLAHTEKELEKAHKKLASVEAKNIANKIKQVNGINVLIEKVDMDPKTLKDIAFNLKNKPGSFIVLASVFNQKPNITVAISNDLVETKKYHAGNIVRELAKEIEGGGGGQPFFATAGGKKAEGVAKALEKAREMVER
ncbi:MAG: alanine--tRNA ligase [Bacteroidetes bacterium]|nr:MAG: alanine--tRNA ligase [Bacteroidota bacterium]